MKPCEPNFATIIVDALGRAELPGAGDPLAACIVLIADDKPEPAPDGDDLAELVRVLEGIRNLTDQPNPPTKVFVQSHFLPAPLRDAPQAGEEVFYVSPWQLEGVGIRTWNGSKKQRRALARGVFYRSYREAREAFWTTSNSARLDN